MPPILALVGIGLTLAEQAASVFARINETIGQGIEEGWADDDPRWKQAALDMRQVTDSLNQSTKDRLDALINPPEET